MSDPNQVQGESPLDGLSPEELLRRGLETVKVSSASAGAWQPPEPEHLSLLLPQFRIEALIGRGGMGAVYRGIQANLERPVAIKLLPAEMAADPEFIARFQREARTLARLNHPGIVMVHEFGQTPEGHLFFVMEFVDGTDLHQIIHGPGLTSEQALEIVTQICDALQYAHSQGVIHRDIKPANVILTRDGRTKLADFGLARPLTEESGMMTRSNIVMGTPDYIAPEAMAGQSDHRADLFSLGVMLYEMLTGQTPRGAWAPPSQRVRVDVRLDEVVIRALQQDPEMRYQQASEMRTDVDIIRTTPPPKAKGKGQAAGKPPSGRPAQPAKAPGATAEPPRRKGVSPAAIAAAVVLTLVVGGLTLWTPTGSQPEQTRDAPVPAVSKSPAKSSTASATTNTPANKPAPAGPNTNPPLALGAYPAGLKVPVPDWLRQAAAEGGRLEVIKTPDFPGEKEAIFDLGEMAEFDDFVAVYRTPYSWMACRSNGDLWGKTWDASQEKEIITFGPIRVRSITRGADTCFVDADGKPRFYPTGTIPKIGAAIEGLDRLVGFSEYEGKLHVLLGTNHEILEVLNTHSGLKAPPNAFLRNAAALTTSSRAFFALEPGHPVRGWNCEKASIIPFEDAPSDVMELSAGSGSVIMLRSNGDVRISSDSSGILYPNSTQPPADLGPALRVRCGIHSAYVAQRTDGSWMAWVPSIKGKKDRTDFIARVAAFGPAIDMETGSSHLPDRSDTSHWAIAIRPKSTPPASTPAANLTAAPSPSMETTTPSMPPWLQEARQKGGKLRLYAGDQDSKIEQAGTDKLDDFIEVAVNFTGWIARRVNGETHGLVWNAEDIPAGKPVTPLKVSRITRGNSIMLRDQAGAFRGINQGVGINKAQLPQPDSVAVANVNGHIVSLGPNGSILDQKSTQADTKPPPPEFFQGFHALTSAFKNYIVARPGERPRSWSIESGSTTGFPAHITDVVELDATGTDVIFLTAQGKVHVTGALGSALSSERNQLSPPKNLAPAIAVRAGNGMCAAQMQDGTWVAWGDSPDLAQKVRTIGPALDLDFHVTGDQRFLLWVEAPAQTPAATPSPAVVSIPAPSAPAPAATPATPSAAPKDEVAERLAAITAQFRTAYDRDIAPGHATAVADLNGKYLAAVERAMGTASAAGNLDEAVRLREETQRVKDKQPLPAVDLDTLPDSLKKLRATYRDTLAKLESDRQEKAKPYYDRYNQLLDAYQKELTQQKRLDDAVRVKTVRDEAAKGRAAPPTEPAAASASVVSPPPAAASTPAISSSPTVTTPAWLAAARQRGGPLKLWGGPEPGADIQVPAKAAKYDDYVRLDMHNTTNSVLFATRLDGSILSLDFSNRASIEVKEVLKSAETSVGSMGTYLSLDGKVRNADGSELFVPVKVKRPAGLVHGYRIGLVYSTQGDFETFRLPQDIEAPPDDFLRGKNIVASASADDGFAFLTSDQKVFGWQGRSKTPVVFDHLQPHKVVRLVSGAGSYAFLTSHGSILLSDDLGKSSVSGTFLSAGSSALKEESGPFVHLQATGFFGAAQRQEGTWLGWSLTPNLPDKLKSLGPVLDVDAREGKRNSTDVGILAWIELPPGTNPEPPASPKQ